MPITHILGEIKFRLLTNYMHLHYRLYICMYVCTSTLTCILKVTERHAFSCIAISVTKIHFWRILDAVAFSHSLGVC
jgi:hypothetical protein